MTNSKSNINESVLSVQSSVKEAKLSLVNNQHDEIIITDNNEFMGLLSKEDLLEIDDNSILMDFKHLLRPVYLREDYTLFDALKIVSVYKNTNIPLVVKEGMTFLGVINANAILTKFENTGLNVEGSTVLVIKKSSQTFSYAEVFQIAEANAAKIFGSYINNSDQTDTEIVLNIFHLGLNELLQSYRRYDYEIVSFHEEDLHHETLRANSDYFSKYLTV